MHFLPGPGTVNIFIRNMRTGGLSDQEIADRMKRRLNLERFDPAKLSEVDAEKYKNLVELIRQLEQPS